MVSTKIDEVRACLELAECDSMPFVTIETEDCRAMMEAAAERDRLRELVRRAVQGLKHVGTFRYESGDDPHPLDCTLAGRVSHVFGMGMTRSIALCREFGEDPEFVNEREPGHDDGDE